MATPTLYLHRQSGLHSLHPLTKLTLTGLFFVAAATLSNLWFVVGVYVLCLLPLAVWGKVIKPFVKTNLLLIWPFALSLFIIQGFFAPGEQILFEVGPFTYTLEGFWLATRFASRILVWLSAATLLMITTRPDKLMLALIERGLPRQIAYIILTSLQIIPRFQDRAEVILDAQRSRGLETEGSFLHRFRTLVPLVTPLILSSVLELDERAIALEARGFSREGKRTSLIHLEDGPIQVILRWILLISILALIGIWIMGLIKT
jgi:energy-coupling factor transport system permease protein